MSGSEEPEGGGSDEDERQTPGPDEVFCMSCGEIIKEKAEICPHCGVRQKEASTSTATETQIPEGRIFELQQVARKDPGIAVILGLLLTPASYLYVDRTELALINFVTLNYLFLGFLIVPFHTNRIIKDAREELERHGEEW